MHVVVVGSDDMAPVWLMYCSDGRYCRHAHYTLHVHVPLYGYIANPKASNIYNYVMYQIWFYGNIYGIYLIAIGWVHLLLFYLFSYKLQSSNSGYALIVSQTRSLAMYLKYYYVVRIDNNYVYYTPITCTYYCNI